MKVIRVTEAQHEKAKALAALAGHTLSDYVGFLIDSASKFGDRSVSNPAPRPIKMQQEAKKVAAEKSRKVNTPEEAVSYFDESVSSKLWDAKYGKNGKK